MVLVVIYTMLEFQCENLWEATTVRKDFKNKLQDDFSLSTKVMYTKKKYSEYEQIFELEPDNWSVQNNLMTNYICNSEKNPTPLTNFDPPIHKKEVTMKMLGFDIGTDLNSKSLVMSFSHNEKNGIFGDFDGWTNKKELLRNVIPQFAFMGSQVAMVSHHGSDNQNGY